MSHHASDFPFNQHSSQEMERLLKDLGMEKTKTKSEIPKLGPQGTFPDGKLASNDEGSIAFGVTNISGRIVIDFGKPIHTIGLTKDEAKGLAELLLKHANGNKT